MKKTEQILLIILFVITSFLRLTQLGYSHFYGDETKVLYWNKTVPAMQYFLDQRKGPLQFLFSWGAEKISGGFDEFAIRLPFALVGLASVFIFYLLVKKLFNYRVAFVASLLFSLNGFFIAFSRTAQ